MTETAPEKDPMPLDGWPLSMALRRLLPEFHLRVLGARLGAAEGMQDAAAIRHYRWVLWPRLVERVVGREVTVTGFAPAVRAGDRTVIDSTWVQDAAPDFDKDTLSLADVTYSGIRFAPAAPDIGSQASTGTVTYRTGTAGRPTSMHLLVDEMKAREGRSELAPSLAAEARHLVEWLARAHPSAATTTPKAAEEGLRQDYRRLKPPETTPRKSST